MSDLNGPEPFIPHGTPLSPNPRPTSPETSRRTRRLAIVIALTLAGGTAGLILDDWITGIVTAAIILAVSAMALSFARSPDNARQSPPPHSLAVIDTPALPQPVIDSPLREMEELLAELCQQDALVMERLIDREQSRHPDLPRRDHVALALRHFRRDRE